MPLDPPKDLGCSESPARSGRATVSILASVVSCKKYMLSKKSIGDSYQYLYLITAGVLAKLKCCCHRCCCCWLGEGGKVHSSDVVDNSRVQDEVVA